RKKLENHLFELFELVGITQCDQDIVGINHSFRRGIVASRGISAF
ncbi:unnamed protein product, partial [marine sediment metagenome]